VGRVKYGFKIEGGRLVPNPDEWATIQLVKFLRDRGKSYRAIGWELLKAGHHPRSGGDWNPNQIRRISQGAPSRV
jgi:hypothetical protein